MAPAGFNSPICSACGSHITQVSFQARAADEPARVIDSCPLCPLMIRRVSLSEPRIFSHSPLSGFIHRRLRSAPMVGTRGGVSAVYVEMRCPAESWTGGSLAYGDNITVPTSVRRGIQTPPMRGYFHKAGEFEGRVVVHRSTSQVTPILSCHIVGLYPSEVLKGSTTLEADGEVAVYVSELGTRCYVHRRTTEKGNSLTIVAEAGSGAAAEVRKAMYTLHSIPWVSFCIRDVLTAAELSSARNLSPRAWDSTYRGASDHVFLHKVDGERCFGILYSRIFYLFKKGREFPLVGWRILDSERGGKAVILDLENTVNSGCVLIDMITDRRGEWSPAGRTYSWVLREFGSMLRTTAPLIIIVRKCYGALAEAARTAGSAGYPTDGVVAIHVGGTTSKKMKKERSIELEVADSRSLLSREGKEVIKAHPTLCHLHPGTIVELRFRLTSRGNRILSSPPFVRNDKSVANSSTAIGNILSSFRGVARDDDIRRRSALTWCYNLRSSLIDRALSVGGTKRIIMDVGTGTGQSLDDLTANRGVSYILVEKDRARCEQISRRLAMSRIDDDPRRLLSAVRSLKSGSTAYCILNCGLESIVRDEEVMTLLSSEVRAATCTFSAHYVLPSLYELSSYWGIPVVGCVYPYDGVEVGGCLVDTLGVRMARISEEQCSVRWGGDEEYVEPFTLLSHYEIFCRAQRATEYIDCPSREADADVHSICSKVFTISSA